MLQLKKIEFTESFPFIRSIASKKSLEETPKIENALEKDIKTTNPYIAARTEWNFMYNDIITGKRNWQIFASILVIANVLLIIGLISIALQKKYVPYVVRVDAVGNAQFGGMINTADQSYLPSTINAYVRRYIHDARSVIADPIAEKQTLDSVYATTRGEALNFINSFFKESDPFKRAKDVTIEVEIKNALPKSPQTYLVSWTETERNLDGDIVSKQNYEALITVRHYPVTDPKEINTNPFGLYTTGLSWSQQL